MEVENDRVFMLFLFCFFFAFHKYWIKKNNKVMVSKYTLINLLKSGVNTYLTHLMFKNINLILFKF